MTHGLTAGQRALLRANLLQQQRGLDVQLQIPLAGGGRVEHTHEMLTQDDDDAPQHLMDREIDMARTDRALHLLGAVSNALARIDEPSFGLCNECGEGISFDRLKLEPWALRCLACECQRENALGLARGASH